MGSPSRIREVWAENFEQEMTVLRASIDHYPYVAMDTEFPGIVARPIGTFKGSSDYHYQTLRCNVDLLRLIQLGLTICDADGNLPPPGQACTWQFNFRFSINDDMCAPDSLELLTKAGLDFDRHEQMGIDVEHFGELLITSGLALFDDVKWVSFHSGYDFGYLLKVVTASPLPPTESEFFELLRVWFPCIYDIKYLMRSCKSLKGGLQDVADDLQVSRIGQQHQAGSDSLLTVSTFFKLRERYFDGKIDDRKYLGCLYGFTHSNGGAVQYTRASSSLRSRPTSTPSTDQFRTAFDAAPPPIPPNSSPFRANAPSNLPGLNALSKNMTNYSGSTPSGPHTPVAGQGKRLFGSTPIGSAGA